MESADAGEKIAEKLTQIRQVATMYPQQIYWTRLSCLSQYEINYSATLHISNL